MSAAVLGCRWMWKKMSVGAQCVWINKRMGGWEVGSLWFGVCHMFEKKCMDPGSPSCCPLDPKDVKDRAG